MKFNKHSDLVGKHAFLSGSQHAWLNYDNDHLAERYRNEKAKQEGTELHEIAENLIRKKIKLPRSNKTLNAYVNDAIGFRLEPEVQLVYSANAFGTADAIRYDERKKFLRIHDLKTGVRPQYKIDKETGDYILDQLRIYAALFFLEYPNIKISETEMELRIYQNDEIFIENPTDSDIQPIMNKIITFDRIIDRIEAEEN